MEQKSNVKEWANPTPAGLVALAISCFGFYALLSGNVSAGAMPLLGCWLLGGFVVQFIVALLDLKGGNKTGGNTFLYFSAFFMLVGGLEMILKTNLLNSGFKFDGHLDGWVWIPLSLTVILWTPAFFKSPLILTLIILALDVATPLIALKDLGILPESYAIIPAYGLLIAGILGVYLSAAIIVNEALGKTIYPNPGPIIKK